jgi:hypothetical protein
MAVPYSFVGVLGGSPEDLPPGRPQVRDRHLKSHEDRDNLGVITVRYNSRLHPIGISKHRRGTKVTVLIDDRDIRIIDHTTGELLRKLTLDPTRD